MTVYVLILDTGGWLAGADYVQECYQPVVGGPVIFWPGVRVNDTSGTLRVDCTIFEPENPLQAGDVIESINGTSVSTLDEFINAAALGVASEEPVSLGVERDGQKLTLTVASTFPG